ncbi:uncharacterized protein LOC124408088 isoform X2 [Diprion similis]|uniref:uncharacterized protein LOC124408088 isoform X2 n=1 Tax=Diprion similis TaxID=362088 RepID=UPI001EF915B2|nr:uncharacterized protein LOC124408088 isoform X2 [Diprion similis]
MEFRGNSNNGAETNLIDVTIFGSPPPQASSTVERRPSLKTWGVRQAAQDNNKTKYSVLNDTDVKQSTVNSSLGILNNISSLLEDSGVMEGKKNSSISNKIETERELARKLLQRCSAPRGATLTSDWDKENDGNIQNLSKDHTPSTLMDSGQQSLLNNSDTLEENTAANQIIFKPTEISARSSVLNNSFDKSIGSSTSSKSRDGISFDTSAAAELIAQFGDEDFQSGSRVESRMVADELSWNQNYPYAMPMNTLSSGEKERLELSCFSGIVGDFDLSSASSTGRRVSVGEFFQRKCGNIGQLQETDSAPRPSFGVTINSPIKHRPLVPLVDETAMTAESSLREVNKGDMESVNCTKQHSLMSLSSIAQVLSDVDNGSPRRLVDELIKAKRRKNLPPSQLLNEPTTQNRETFTCPPHSLPFNSLAMSVNEKPERDTTMKGHKFPLNSPKLSLDSKTVQEFLTNKSKLSRMSLNVGLGAIENHNKSDTYNFMEKCTDGQKKMSSAKLEKTFNEPKDTNKSCIYRSSATRNLLSCLDDSIDAQKPNLNVQSFEQDPNISGKNLYDNQDFCQTPKKSQSMLQNSMTFQNITSAPIRTSASFLKNMKIENNKTATPGLTSSFKRSFEKTLHSAGTSSLECNADPESSYDISQFNQNEKTGSHGDDVTAKNTNELCSCIVGVPREAEIELSNGTDRWMSCTLTLYQIQGSKENIVLKMPKDAVLVAPNDGKLVKIGVIVRQMREPVIVVINIAVSDVVTRSSKVIKHVMCFVPEEPQIGVMIHTGQNKIDFQIVAEKCSKTFPVTLENKNNAELPIRLIIVKHPNQPQVFSIDCSADETACSLNENEVKYNLTLKPHQQSTVNIQFNGISLSSFNVQKALCHATGKLFVQLRTDDSKGLLFREISLAGSIGVSKIDLVDTQLPIVVPKRDSKPIGLVNSGVLAVTLTTSLVENDKSTSSAGDFSIKPNTLFLQAGEKGIILVTHKSRMNDSGERQAVIKVIAGGNEYYYPVIGDSTHLRDQLSPSNMQRSTTPLSQERKSKSPTSPRSSASTRSGNSGRHSPCSTGSASTISGDVIPIQATHAALVWSSIKTGKSDIKEFSVLNKSENKLRLQVNIVDNNKSFKFLKDRHTVGTNMVLALQRMTSKVISVQFSPSNPGACAGKILFSHYSGGKEPEESSHRKTIFLYGYGGVGKVEISQAFKDTSGLMWLSLGHMDTVGNLSARIKLQNTGNLCSYAVVKVIPKALYPEMISSWHVTPSELLLGPGEIQWIRLEFHPRREDLALLRRADISQVIGTLSITHGDEPTRWRIRRLYKKLKESGKFRGQEDDIFKNIVYPLCRAFPGEELVQDLSIIKETVQHLGDLCRGVYQHQVMLTVEVNADDTLTVLNDNADDTQMFNSVCSDSSSIFTAGCNSYMLSETIVDGNGREMSESDFTVTPSVVNLTPPFRTEATVTVSSFCSVAQPFETVLSHSEGVSVVPTEGMIPAKRSFPLKVQCSKQIKKNTEAVLQIFMENQKRSVLITISSSN